MLTFLIIVASLFFLVRSAEVFVNQASALASKLRVNDFIIGFTVVAFGTSLPELISSIFTSISGHNKLLVSNIVGSNITNLCLILGVTALFNNYRIRKRDIDINIPINLAAMMAFWALSSYMGLTLNWASGISMILIFFVLLILSREYNHFETKKVDYGVFNPLSLNFSLAVLVLSGKICVDQIINFASVLNVSETILGYFLLAIGTSLPELVTTWVAVKKNDGELGIGSILGSNLFNLLFIFGVSTFIRPVVLKDFVFDLVFLTGTVLMVYVFAIIGKKYTFSKKEGFGLFGIYLIFIIFQLSKNLH